jgi:CheY-like chemotaxis protein
MLASAGYRVVSTGDGEDAIRLAKQDPPDLILLDMILPKLSGQQVLEALKRDSPTAHIPVIVLSSLSQKNETKLKNAGAAAYFEKSKLEVQKYSDLLLQAVRDTLKNSAPDFSEAETHQI